MDGGDGGMVGGPPGLCGLRPPPHVLVIVPEIFLPPFTPPSAPGGLKKEICVGIGSITVFSLEGGGV